MNYTQDQYQISPKTRRLQNVSKFPYVTNPQSFNTPVMSWESSNLSTLPQGYTSTPSVGPYLVHHKVSLSWLACHGSTCLMTKILCQALLEDALLVGQLVAASTQVLITSVSASRFPLSYKCSCLYNPFQADFFVSEVSAISQLIQLMVLLCSLLSFLHEHFGANVLPDSFV